MKKKLFNPELDRYDIYTEVWIPEKIKVKDEKDLIVVNHYWQDSDGELWGDFKHPMENVLRSFDAYRKRKGYLTPREIKELRQKLNLSVRKFANALGISSSALTQIENNHRIQTKYQEILFENVLHNPQEFIARLKNKGVDTKLNVKAYNPNHTEFYENKKEINYIISINNNLGDAA